jgi:hypothetical protein
LPGEAMIARRPWIAPSRSSIGTLTPLRGDVIRIHRRGGHAHITCRAGAHPRGDTVTHHCRPNAALGASRDTFSGKAGLMEILPVKRSGMLTFAGIMLIIAGSLNLLDGVVALVKDDYFLTDELLFGDLSGWGIWWLFVGLLMTGAGFQVMNRKEAGLGLGIGLAGLNLFTQLMFLKVHPGWAVSIMVLDVIIIWAICANADEFE